MNQIKTKEDLINYFRKGNKKENQFNKLAKSHKQNANKTINNNFSLSVHKLCFSYYGSSENEYLFKDISFSMKDNKTLVIKGASGSGKSTLLMLLIGVLRSNKGLINWGGFNIDEINSDVFRENIGYVGPEPYIIKGTVIENLCYGLDTLPKQHEIINACELANVNIFLNNLPKEYDTILTEQGEGLSMGQKQRLGLARALLRKPKLLVLDEITANLDSDTEKLIVSNLQSIKNDISLIVATHSNAFDTISDLIIDLPSN